MISADRFLELMRKKKLNKIERNILDEHVKAMMKELGVELDIHNMKTSTGEYVPMILFGKDGSIKKYWTYGKGGVFEVEKGKKKPFRGNIRRRHKEWR